MRHPRQPVLLHDDGRRHRIAAPYQSSDPKLGPVHTEYPEVKLIWEAEALRGVPFFRWFAGGTFEISYGYYYPEHQLRQRPRAPDGLHDAILGRDAAWTIA